MSTLRGCGEKTASNQGKFRNLSQKRAEAKSLSPGPNNRQDSMKLSEYKRQSIYMQGDII